MGLDGPDAASWTATSSPAILTTTWPPGIATTLTRRPMQRLGTDHSLPAALTSMVGGTVWTLTSPTIDSRSRRFPMGRRLSFSRMNSASWIGNTYLDDSGRDSPASLNSTGDM